MTCVFVEYEKNLKRGFLHDSKHADIFKQAEG